MDNNPTDRIVLTDRIASIMTLVREYDRETDKNEKDNIMRTIVEIVENKPIALPTQTLEEWEKDLASTPEQLYDMLREARRVIAAKDALLQTVLTPRNKK